MPTEIKPILMSSPMIRALMDGRKTQTRRVMKPQPEITRRVGGDYARMNGHLGPADYLLGDVAPRFWCPYGKPGDWLWVRETFWTDTINGKTVMAYAADEINDCKWKPSIYMPRWASRLTLELTEVRVERLQGITEPDCWAEGIEEVDGMFDSEIPTMAKKLAYRMRMQDRLTLASGNPSMAKDPDPRTIGCGCFHSVSTSRTLMNT